MLLTNLLPNSSNILLNILIRSIFYGVGFLGLAIWINPAPEILKIFTDFFSAKKQLLFRKGIGSKNK
jgi:hypothetical protein